MQWRFKTWTGFWSRWDAKLGSKDLQEDWFIYCWLSSKCGALEMQRSQIIPPSYRRPLKWLLQSWLHRQTLLRWPQWPYHNPGLPLIPIAAQKTITRSLETTTMIIITTTGRILLITEINQWARVEVLKKFDMKHFVRQWGKDMWLKGQSKSLSWFCRGYVKS